MEPSERNCAPPNAVHQSAPAVSRARKYCGKLPDIFFTQPKLDGVHAIAAADGLWSRSGHGITSCPHIELGSEDRLRHPSGLILDGELYNHDLCDDLFATISAVNGRKRAIGSLSAPRGRGTQEPTTNIMFSAGDEPVAWDIFLRSAGVENIAIRREGVDQEALISDADIEIPIGRKLSLYPIRPAALSLKR